MMLRGEEGAGKWNLRKIWKLQIHPAINLYTSNQFGKFLLGNFSLVLVTLICVH
jgi:hypothetical protein